MERRKKQKVVEELRTKLKALNNMFLTGYSGMNMAQITRLRRELRNVDVEFSVVKNSLFKIASGGTKAEALKDKFYGPNAIICIYKDPTSAARVISSLSKDIPNLKLKAGFLGKQIITPEEIMKIATLPSKEILMGKFLGLLQGMPQRLLYVLSGNISKLMTTLNAIKLQKEQA
ncbi:MAG: 50S ribosomal protein L10 [Proteobacteria bacterium]|nr:50S ribosomal protein L10 [Pseudomonadota bacterium]